MKPLIYSIILLLLSTLAFSQKKSVIKELRKWNEGNLSLSEFKIDSTITRDSMAVGYFSLPKIIQRNDTSFLFNEYFAAFAPQISFIKDNSNNDFGLQKLQLYFDYIQLLAVQFKTDFKTTPLKKSEQKKRFKTDLANIYAFWDKIENYSIASIQNESRTTNDSIKQLSKTTDIPQYKISNFGFEEQLLFGPVFYNHKKLSKYWTPWKYGLGINGKLKIKNIGLGIEMNYERISSAQEKELSLFPLHFSVLKFSSLVDYKQRLNKHFNLIFQANIGYITYFLNSDELEKINNEVSLGTLFFRPNIGLTFSRKPPFVYVKDKLLSRGFWILKTGANFFKFNNKIIYNWDVQFGFGFYLNKLKSINY